MLERVPVELWQGSTGIAAVYMAFQFAKWAVVRRNGKSTNGHAIAQAQLCRDHAERIAANETLTRMLQVGQKEIQQKVGIVARDVNKLLMQFDRRFGSEDRHLNG